MNEGARTTALGRRAAGCLLAAAFFIGCTDTAPPGAPGPGGAESTSDATAEPPPDVATRDGASTPDAIPIDAGQDAAPLVDAAPAPEDAAAIDAVPAEDATPLPDPDATPPDAGCVAIQEACNGLDDDCDGVADELFGDLGQPCTVGVGACASEGARVCAADGTDTACAARAGAPIDELCNAADDDCDGQTDELFGDLGDACTVGVGACLSQGQRVCAANGADTACAARAGEPVEERCNAADDDCDGQTDEVFPDLGDDCTVGQGACESPGQLICAADGAATACDAAVILPGVELCNAEDDDCDGDTDEALVQACYGGPDGTEGVGLCRAGRTVCVDGAFGHCEGEVGPAVEICGDAVDQDCDGALACAGPGGVAEGFPVSSGPDDGRRVCTDLAFAPDGHLWLVGTTWIDVENGGATVWKVTPEGQIVDGFPFYRQGDAGGDAPIDRANAVSIDAQGTVWVAGKAYNTEGDGTVWRYTPDGQLLEGDPVLVDGLAGRSPNEDFADIVTLADGAAIAVGVALDAQDRDPDLALITRIEADGTTRNWTFDSDHNGSRLWPTSLALGPDGTVWGGGGRSPTLGPIILWRINPAGPRVAQSVTFRQPGAMYEIVIDANGDIYGVGTSRIDNQTRTTLWRFGPDGLGHPDFPVYVPMPEDAASSFGTALALGPEGNIWTLGRMTRDGGRHLMITAFDPTGQPLEGHPIIIETQDPDAPPVPSAMTFDRHGRLWFCGFFQGQENDIRLMLYRLD